MSPLGLLVCALAGLKRFAYQQRWCKQTQIGVPLIVVGNLSVGGSGKSPLVTSIARLLVKQGYQPGIICRGYKGQATCWPQAVNPDSDPMLMGDEAVMLARQTGCPVMAGANRVQAAQSLRDETKCDVIVSDDGFQHLKLARDIDIVVIDAARGLGNHWCLPAGPLREAPVALKAADMVVYHLPEMSSPTAADAYKMRLQPATIYAVNSGASGEIESLKQAPLHAVAGIGHPARFFETLRQLGLTIIEHPFPDHHLYEKAALKFDDAHDIITTEKDALKLAALNLTGTIWVLPVQAVLDQAFETDLLAKLNALSHD